MNEWTHEHRRVAQAEGWDIFETNREEDTEHKLVNGKVYGHRPFELQCDDEAGLFPDDLNVWSHVWHCAEAGSRLHQDALAFLKAHSLPEFEAIQEHCGRKG